MATRKQVEAKLNELTRRLEAAGADVHGSLAETLPDRKVIDLHVTDLDEHFWTEMSGGRLGAVRAGEAGDADIRVSIGSDDLIDLVEGRTNLFSKYLLGHVRIAASIGDLLRLRRLAG